MILNPIFKKVFSLFLGSQTPNVTTATSTTIDLNMNGSVTVPEVALSILNVGLSRPAPDYNIFGSLFDGIIEKLSVPTKIFTPIMSNILNSEFTEDS